MSNLNNLSFGDMIEHIDGFSSAWTIEPGSPEANSEKKSLGKHSKRNHKVTLPDKFYASETTTIKVAFYPIVLNYLFL